MSKKREQKAIMHIENVNDFEDVEVLGGSENEEKENAMFSTPKRKEAQQEQDGSATASKKSKVPQSSNNQGPFNFYFSPKSTVLGKILKQIIIDENNLAKKELRECVALVC